LGHGASWGIEALGSGTNANQVRFWWVAVAPVLHGEPVTLRNSCFD